MKKISPLRRATGLVMLMVGVTWFLIGVNIITGSQFSGRAVTSIVGAIVAIAGVGVLQLPFGRRKDDIQTSDGTPEDSA